MYQQAYHAYAENKDLHVQIAHISYSSDTQDMRFVFTVVLPNKGVSLAEVEKKLTSNLQLRQQILSNESTTFEELEVYLPKFKLETSYELSDILVGLGMEDAFNDKKADFEGIIGKVNDANRICISKVS
jgi:serine protease inhibitor